eukprot:719574-Pelagomonas_calceolata.AAC.1
MALLVFLPSSCCKSSLQLLKKVLKFEKNLPEVSHPVRGGNIFGRSYRGAAEWGLPFPFWGDLEDWRTRDSPSGVLFCLVALWWGADIIMKQLGCQQALALFLVAGPVFFLCLPAPLSLNFVVGSHQWKIFPCSWQ